LSPSIRPLQNSAIPIHFTRPSPIYPSEWLWGISLYVLCLFSVIGLGYFGGELVYGTKVPAAGVAEGPAAEGAIVFKQNCSACHLTDSTATKIGPGLKGVFKGDKFLVSGWPVSEDNFRKQLQKPFDKMPPFKHLKEEELKAIVDYLKAL